MDQITNRTDDTPEVAAELTTTEARQGETSGHVKMILASGLTLALIVFLVLYATMID